MAGSSARTWLGIPAALISSAIISYFLISARFETVEAHNRDTATRIDQLKTDLSPKFEQLLRAVCVDKTADQKTLIGCP